MYVSRSWKVALVLIFSFLVLNLGYLKNLRAQIQKDEIDFEVLATVTYKKADTLWKLADKYYGNPRLWPIIAYVNRIYDSEEFPVGVVIYIPAQTVKKPINRTAMDELSAEIAELKKEILSATEKKKVLEATNQKSARLSTNGENVTEHVEPILDQIDVEPEEIETTAKSDETTFDTEISEAPPLAGETGRNLAGKWQLSLALVAAASLLLSLIRVF